MNRREDQIESLLTATVEALGCELWGIEFLSQGRHSKLRVYIERPGGVTVDDCERVSREIGDLLDVEDVIPSAYTLEVSSPGLDRILFKAEQFQANVGAVVDVRLRFGLPERAHDGRTCILVVTVDSQTVGLLVDAVNEVKSFPPETISAPPQRDDGKATCDYVAGLGKQGDEVTILLDIHRLLFDAQLRA